MTFRITKIICPCCKGSGKWFDIPEHHVPGGGRRKAIAVPCNWCDGEKRLPVERARKYADHLYTIAVGGYVCGDHDIKDRDRMVVEATAVFDLLGEVPTWLRDIGSKRRVA